MIALFTGIPIEYKQLQRREKQNPLFQYYEVKCKSISFHGIYNDHYLAEIQAEFLRSNFKSIVFYEYVFVNRSQNVISSDYPIYLSSFDFDVDCLKKLGVPLIS